MEDGTANTLPTKQDEEFRPFIRRLPEFKFWHSATRAIGISFLCSWFEIFDVPVFWPVLVMYWLILFFLTSTFAVSALSSLLGSPFCPAPANLATRSAETNPAHDQVPLRALLLRQGPLRQQEQLVSCDRAGHWWPRSARHTERQVAQGSCRRPVAGCWRTRTSRFADAQAGFASGPRWQRECASLSALIVL